MGTKEEYAKIHTLLISSIDYSSESLHDYV